jgi:transposase
MAWRAKPMPRKSPILFVSPDVCHQLEVVVRSKSEEARRIQRAKIILGLKEGGTVKALAAKLGIRSNTVIDCRRRFEAHGIASLNDMPRSGQPRKYDEATLKQILNKLEEKPPDGMACWDGPTLATALNLPAHAVWGILRKNNICLKRQRSWCVSTDPEFAAKAADVVGLYLDPPCNAIVISIDEKPSIQALSRTTGYVQTTNGKIVRAYKSTYRRNGTLNLFAALEVATGAVTGKVTERKTRADFLAFMDDLLAGYPKREGIEFHVIIDNYCIHKKNEEWLAAHPNVHFHYTPTSASWLNMVEIWFGIMSRKVLRGASHDSKPHLKEAIEAYIAAYDKIKKPFKWRKREVKGTQIRDTIVNLIN